MNTWINLLAGVLILAGTMGSVLPFLPGLPVAWVGLFIYAWAGGFTNVTWGLLVVAALIGLTIVIDILAPVMAAKGYKASRYGVWGAFLGALFGIALLGPIGIILGPFAGAFIGEILNARTHEDALRVAVGAMYGFIIGSAFKVFIGVGIFIYFIVKLF